MTLDRATKSTEALREQILTMVLFLNLLLLLICRYKDECKFYKKDNCAFRHVETKKKVVGEDIEAQINIWIDEIENLKVEIIHLKEDINIKKEELSKSKLEMKQMNIKHTHALNDIEHDLTKENNYLKNQVNVLQKENEAMKIKVIKKRLI